MTFCNNCGQPNPDGAKFCSRCGSPMAGGQSGGGGNSGKKAKGSSWIDSLNNYVGNKGPADLNWRVLFSDVFKSHTPEEAEEIFICGTKTTTPSPYEVSQDWPHPWLYSRVLVILFAVTFLLWICVTGFGNANAIPGMIVMGSFTVPIATMILFMEVNAWRNVSVYYVLMTFLVGGGASLVLTLVLYSINNFHSSGYFGAFLIALFEETGKAVIVYAFIKKLKKTYILSGMLIGACVGAGFAAFESAGYAMTPLLQFLQQAGFAAAQGVQLSSQELFSDINNIMILRGILAPGGHVAWAAISGAGIIIAAKARGNFEPGLLLDKHFLKLFLIPVVLHMLWDCPIQNFFYQIFPYSGVIALLVAVWIVVLILINMGLSEVSAASESDVQVI